MTSPSDRFTLSAVPAEPDAPRPTAAELRAAALRLVREGPRRLVPTRVFVGSPTAAHRSATVAESADHAARADLLTVLVEGWLADSPDASGPIVWLTRRGDLEVADLDLAWFATTMTVAGELGLGLPFAVVTRRGWWDPRTDRRHTWRRLRP